MKRRPLSIILIFLFAVAGITGCGKAPSADDKVLATVGNKNITLKYYKYKLSRLPSYYQSMAEKNKNSLLDDIIVESLFMEDALRKGLDRDREISEILEEAKKKIIIAKLIKTEVDDKVTVPEDEMKKFYEEHKEDFKTPEMWRASHILLASEGEAKEALKELSEGKKFEELAMEKSTDATAARGGDVGYFRRAQVLPEFEDACFALKVGQTSGIVHTQFGYHIIRLTDRKSESVESYEEAGPRIEQELKLKKRAELFNELVADLKDRYRVNIEPDAAAVLDAVKGQDHPRRGKR